MSKTVGFLRRSLFLPPLAHVALAVIPSRWDGFMTASLYFGGVPYVFWAAAMVVLLGRLPGQWFRRLVASAPLTYFTLFAVWFVGVGVVTDRGTGQPGVLSESTIGAIALLPMVLLTGYFWVLVVSLVWWIRNLARSTPEAA